MAQKFLLGPIVFTVFHVSCLLFDLVFKSEFTSGIKNVKLPNEIIILINMND